MRGLTVRSPQQLLWQEKDEPDSLLSAQFLGLRRTTALSTETRRSRPAPSQTRQKRHRQSPRGYHKQTQQLTLRREGTHCQYGPPWSPGHTRQSATRGSTTSQAPHFLIETSRERFRSSSPNSSRVTNEPDSRSRSVVAATTEDRGLRVPKGEFSPPGEVLSIPTTNRSHRTPSPHKRDSSEVGRNLRGPPLC